MRGSYDRQNSDRGGERGSSWFDRGDRGANRDEDMNGSVSPRQVGGIQTEADCSLLQNLQSWALSVFLNFFNNKMIICIFHQVNLTGSELFK